MPRIAIVVVIALLVTTAGCQALEYGDDREPYEVDDAFTGDEFETEQPAGIADDELTSGIALESEHREQLDAQPHRETRLTTFKNESGERIETWVETRSVAGGGAPALVDVEIGGPVAESHHRYTTRERWYDGETTVLKLVDEDGNTTYVEESESGVDPAMPISLADVAQVVDTVEREGGHYRLTGTASTFDSYENLSVELFLTDAGLVEYYHVEGIIPAESEYHQFEHFVEIEPNEGGPAEPDWLDEAESSLEHGS
ncbi:hypothetical protein ACLI4Q_15065 [Natrialbaceae archaeon A-CW1-1]